MEPSAAGPIGLVVTGAGAVVTDESLVQQRFLGAVSLMRASVGPVVCTSATDCQSVDQSITSICISSTNLTHTALTHRGATALRTGEKEEILFCQTNKRNDGLKAKGHDIHRRMQGNQDTSGLQCEVSY